MRDSVALRSYADSRSQAISDSRAWLCKSTWDKATGRERVRYLLVAGRKRLGPRKLPIDPPSQDPARAINQRDREARIRAHARAGAWERDDV